MPLSLPSDLDGDMANWTSRLSGDRPLPSSVSRLPGCRRVLARPTQSPRFAKALPTVVDLSLFLDLLLFFELRGRVFQSGVYRRSFCGANQKHVFYDPTGGSRVGGQATVQPHVLNQSEMEIPVRSGCI
jgi:hypothetical protein